MSVRITDRAADEAARLLSLTSDDARKVLTGWLVRVTSAQEGVVGANGQRSYRGPKPWRLQLVVDGDDGGPGEALVTVVATADTRRWQAEWRAGRGRRPTDDAPPAPAPPAPTPTTQHGGRRRGLEAEGEAEVLPWRPGAARLAWLRATAEARDVSVAQVLRDLVDAAMR